MTAFIANRQTGNEIVIDYDIFFVDFEIIAIPYTNKLLSELETHLGTKISAAYRRSSSGNTHVRLTFPESLTVLEGFEIRMFMGDCQDRIRLDMIRYLRTQDIFDINKAFDTKYQFDEEGNPESKSAGQWKILPRRNISEMRCGEIWENLGKMEQATKNKKCHKDWDQKVLAV